MVMCFAACCSHRSARDKCSFFTFPRDGKGRALWTRLSRRADKKPNNDSRLCSCHFKDGKKENGPTIFFYREGKQFDFPDPEKRYRKKVLDDLEDAPNSDRSPSLKLKHFFDSERKLRERKHKNTQNCPCCDDYTPCNVIHKKYKRNYLKKNVIKDNRTSSIDENVDIVEMKDNMVASLSNISVSSINSGAFNNLLPTKIGNTTVYRYLPGTVISPDVLSSAVTTEKVLLAANRSGNTPLTITNYVSSTTLTPANILFRTDKFINSPSILQSAVKIKSEETLSNNFECVQENDLHESDVDSVQNGSSNSISESNISPASEQINNITDAEAFCAIETLLHYMMNQDDVDSTDINFIVNLAQKIKKRLSVKQENTTENL